jgi:hypothetical protein
MAEYDGLRVRVLHALHKTIDLQLTCHGTNDSIRYLHPVLKYASWAQSSITYLNRHPPPPYSTTAKAHSPSRL